MILYSAYYPEKDPFGIFKDVVTVHHPNLLDTDGALILWGGEDISPSLYGQKSVHAHAANTPSRRDQIETALFKTAVNLGIPIIGICRGAQLACALSGGTLFQHIVGGHHGQHEVSTYKNEVYTTSSCHHQALNLENVKHDLLAWDKDRVTVAKTDKDSVEVVIPEVAVLKDTKTFAIQGHPEWMRQDSPFVKWCAQELKERLL